MTLSCAVHMTINQYIYFYFPPLLSLTVSAWSPLTVWDGHMTQTHRKQHILRHDPRQKPFPLAALSPISLPILPLLSLRHLPGSPLTPHPVCSPLSNWSGFLWPITFSLIHPPLHWASSTLSPCLQSSPPLSTLTPSRAMILTVQTPL